MRLYGDKIPEELVNQGSYWTLVDNRKLIMSCYHISQKTASAYVAKLNEFQPSYIHSRPSAIFPLAKNIIDLNVKVSFALKAIFLDGEVLTDGQRDLLEKAFQTRVYMTYGHTEGCTVGISCDKSRLMHFIPQVGVLELLKPDGTQVTEEGAMGEMVVTGFNNAMFPLIRYRTFDMGVLTKQKCPCGRNFMMLNRVEGRVQDYAINKSLEPIPVAPAVFNYNDMNWIGIKEFRVRQDIPGKLTFMIVREPGALESELMMQARLLKAFEKIFAGMFDITLEYTQELPRTRIGKFRYLDQRLDMSRYGLTGALS